MEPHRLRMVCMLSSLHCIRLYRNGNGAIEDGAAMELPSDCMAVPIVYGGADRSMAASDCMAVPMGAWLDG